MAYSARYGGGFVDLPSQTTAVDSQFLNAVELALLTLFDTDPSADGQVLQWIDASSKYGPAKILNKNVDAAAAIAWSKLSTSGAITNADVSSSAAIAKSKLDFGTGLLNTDIAAAAAIVPSKVAWPVAATSTALKALYPSSTPTDGSPAWLRPAGSDDRLPVFWDATLTKWVSPVQVAVSFSSFNAADGDTMSSGTYANMGGNEYVHSAALPWAVYNTAGFTWQFRWKSTIHWPASQSAFGIRLTAYGANVGADYSQDTTNTFGEILTFTANSTKLVDSGWVAINASATPTDFLAVIPQWKSDGTRTIQTMHPNLFTCHARLVGA